MFEDTHLRQLDIFNPEETQGWDVEIIGAGGVGSFLALALAKLGVKKLKVWEKDKIEIHNVSNQMCRQSDVSNPKV